MAGRETNSTWKKFLETTHSQLDARYLKIGVLLKRRYFTH
jgi:hypothetical protein